MSAAWCWHMFTLTKIVIGLPASRSIHLPMSYQANQSHFRPQSCRWFKTSPRSSWETGNFASAIVLTGPVLRVQNPCRPPRLALSDACEQTLSSHVASIESAHEDIRHEIGHNLVRRGSIPDDNPLRPSRGSTPRVLHESWEPLGYLPHGMTSRPRTRFR